MVNFIPGPLALKIQWNLDLVTDLVTQKSVTKSWVVTKSMYFMYWKTRIVFLKKVTKSRLSLNLWSLNQGSTVPYEFQQRSLSINSLHLFFVSFLWSNLKVQNRWQVISHFSSKTAIFKSLEKCLKIKSFIDSYLSWWEQLLNGLPTFLPPRRHPFKQTYDSFFHS